MTAYAEAAYRQAERDVRAYRAEERRAVERRPTIEVEARSWSIEAETRMRRIAGGQHRKFFWLADRGHFGPNWWRMTDKEIRRAMRRWSHRRVH